MVIQMVGEFGEIGVGPQSGSIVTLSVWRTQIGDLECGTGGEIASVVWPVIDFDCIVIDYNGFVKNQSHKIGNILGF